MSASTDTMAIAREQGSSMSDLNLKAAVPAEDPNWLANLSLLWDRRHTLARIAGASMLLSLAIAFLLPKRYESSARILPPGNPLGGAALLTPLAGHSSSLSGSLAFAGGLFGGSSNTSLFMDLLRSGTVSSHLIDRFNLQRVYGKRYRVDAAKSLARRTKIVDDKKSGVITLTVTDTDPTRARDIAQAYLDELNQLVNRTNISSARQERIFLEDRLHGLQRDLAGAQQRLSDFASAHATVDIKDQAHAMVDAAARLESQLIFEQSNLNSLRQVYGDDNVRIRQALARIDLLKAEIVKTGGSSSALSSADGKRARDMGTSEAEETIYPTLRQLPRLAIPYANLTREVQTQEVTYALLTQQYELARIQEAKDIPVVSVIDSPGVPEKKSFPPRILLTLASTLTAIVAAAAFLLLADQWRRMPDSEPRKLLAMEMARSAKRTFANSLRFARISS